MTYIIIWLNTIEGLPIGFHLNFWQFWRQNSYGCRTILRSFSDAFFDRSQSLSKSAEKSWMLHMKTSIWVFLLRYSRKDVGRIFLLIIKFFQIDQKIANASNDDVFWEFLKIFSQKDVGRKNVHFLPTSIGVKWFNFTLKDVSRMTQSVIGTIPPGGAWGSGSPPNVSTPFLPGRRHPVGSEAPP